MWVLEPLARSPGEQASTRCPRGDRVSGSRVLGGGGQGEWAPPGGPRVPGWGRWSARLLPWWRAEVSVQVLAGSPAPVSLAPLCLGRVSCLAVSSGGTGGGGGGGAALSPVWSGVVWGRPRNHAGVGGSLPTPRQRGSGYRDSVPGRWARVRSGGGGTRAGGVSGGFLQGAGRSHPCVPICAGLCSWSAAGPAGEHLVPQFPCPGAGLSQGWP